LIILFILGLAFGSFLNVLIHRLPKGQSIISPGSYCPECKHKISIWENIPILSFLILGGRCRICKKPIPIQYPLVELLMGLMTYFIFWKDGLTIYLPFHLFLVGALIVLSVIDLQQMIIPDQITYPGIAVGIIFSLIVGRLIPGLIGIAIGGGIIYLIRVIGGAIYKGEVMGGGDVKLCLMLGGFLHPLGMIMTLILASLIGAASGIILIIVGRRSRVLPFGPFLSIGAIITIFYYYPIMDWYGILIRSY